MLQEVCRQVELCKINLGEKTMRRIILKIREADTYAGYNVTVLLRNKDNTLTNVFTNKNGEIETSNNPDNTAFETKPIGGIGYEDMLMFADDVNKLNYLGKHQTKLHNDQNKHLEDMRKIVFHMLKIT